jgi:hypothetical protein
VAEPRSVRSAWHAAGAQVAARYWLLLPLAAVAALYAAGFAGWFVGDDHANLHQAYAWQQQGEFWSRLLAQFGSGVTDQSAFYRPLIIASLNLNYLLAGSDYSGWYLVNYALHLAAVLLVALCVRRLLELHEDASNRAGAVAAMLAALWFGLNPLLAEGVFWVSARSDSSVTVLSLLGLACWLGRGRAGPWLLPVLLLPALLFKESAAVLPLQVSLLWLASPALRSRSRSLALLACYALLLAYLGYRLLLFGDAWQTYGGGAGSQSQLPDPQRLLDALRSVAPWWQGLFGGSPAALGFAVASLTAIALALPGNRRWHLPLALVAATGGLLLATFLNLGELVAHGEGGRLLYTPCAWYALALGVAIAGCRWRPLALAATAAVAIATLAAGWLQQSLLTRAVAAQQQLQLTAAALPAWAARDGRPALLLVPDHLGPIVVGRNAQGALVLPPVQAEPLLSRVLPTLPSEVPARHELYRGGLLDVLEGTPMHYWDNDALAAYTGPRRPRWPQRVLCWGPDGQLAEFDAPPADAAEHWAAAILADAKRHRCRWR